MHVKPYVELKDSDGREDEVVAEEVCTRIDLKWKTRIFLEVAHPV